MSGTVIYYWEDIGFTPAYFHTFWLMRDQKAGSYEQWMDDKASLIDGIKMENELLGEAAWSCCHAERNALEWMRSNDRRFIYQLKESFDDGSEEILILSSDIDVIMEEMRAEIHTEAEDDGYPGDQYYIDRFRVDIGENGFVNIDAKQSYGRMVYNANGILADVHTVKRFGEDDTGNGDMLSSYLFLPHPFKKGDAVSFHYGDEINYGVLSYPCDEVKTNEALSSNGQNLDEPAYTATVETIYMMEGEKRFAIGHDHICPLYLDRVKADLTDGDGPNPEMLYVMRQIVTGESVSLNELSYYMG